MDVSGYGLRKAFAGFACVTATVLATLPLHARAAGGPEHYPAPARVGNTASPQTATAPAPRTTAGPLQVIGDPGFAAGSPNPYWARSSPVGKNTITTYWIGTIQPLTGTPNPDGDGWTGDFCGRTSCSNDLVAQGFSDPTDVGTASLNYYAAWLCTGPTDCSTSDELQVGLQAADGSSTWDLGWVSPGTCNFNTYAFCYYDLTSNGGFNVSSFLQAHAGQGITVVAKANTGSSDASRFFVDDVTLTVNQTPDAPTNVTAVSNAAGSMTVSWTAPVFEGTGSVTSYAYTVYNSKRQQVTTGGTSASPVTITGLTNGSLYYVGVSATNAYGTGAQAFSNSATPLAGTTPPARMTAATNTQYFMPNSDGSTWQVIDETNVSLGITTTGAEDVLLGGNADLWTGNAGYNQDIGIEIKAQGSATTTLVAWKESGGFAGTFSPNAAYVEGVTSLSASTTYIVYLVWKTNKAAIGQTVAAGAGSTGNFSPTRLSAVVLPSGYHSAQSQLQYHLSNSDGSTWTPIDGTNLSTSFTPGSNEDVVVSGNADLWTANAGYNQDIGISVNGAAPTAWKESGGFAGTFSPNAAYVQTVVHLTASTPYTFQLVWKTNKTASGATIFAGAGPINSNYSNTRLTVYPLPTDTTLWGSSVSTSQYLLTGSDGSTWRNVDGTLLTKTLIPDVSEPALVSANVDLWTMTAGVNQDISIWMTDNGGAPVLVAWKESGGFAGTFSPNAAFVQGEASLLSGHTYIFTVEWKSNQSTSGTIVAAAGSSPTFSPTRLSIVPGS